MTIPRYFLFIAVFLFLFLPASAFEDTFQYYPSGDYNNTWYTAEDGANDIYHDIFTYGGTYSRCFRLGLDNDGAAGEYVQLWHYTPSASNYWSVNSRYLYAWSAGSNWATIKLNTYFYDEDGYLLFSHGYVTQNFAVQTWPNLGSGGHWEYLRDSGSNLVSLRIDGVNYGVVGSASKPMAYISFRIDEGEVPAGGSSPPSLMYIDDVTNGNGIVGIGTESTTHSVTEAFGTDTNISFGLDTFPLASFTTSEYKVDINIRFI